MPKEVQNTDESVFEYLKSLTLLCVEDNKTTQILYESIFEDIVQDIIFASNGKDGYDKYINNAVDIIISDYDMPVLNGLQMCEKIRKDDQEIPIIFVTAINEVDVIVQALHLKVNAFIKKPIIAHEVKTAILNVSKLLIANQYLEELRNKKLAELEEKDKYSNYQEDLAFKKELNILRNDFYYQMIECHTCQKNCHHFLIDFLYHPLDTLSGDAYSARALPNHKTFYLIVDGMGKGLSASLSTMIITSYINHTIDIMLESDNFDLEQLISMAIKYIQPILLDEEALAIEFIVLDCSSNLLEYAKFAMPATLMQNQNNEIIKIKSNNPPLSKYNQKVSISSVETEDMTKFLFFSDGVIENTIKNKNDTYSAFIEEDFLHSFTREDFKNRLFQKIDTQEDDITLIYINKLNFHETNLAHAIFNTSLEDIDSANDWYNNEWKKITDNPKILNDSNIVFTELYMNAYEHGNLGINSKEKHKLLEDDIYFETLQEKEKGCSKQITVSINKIDYASSTYLITYITDEGDGFNTQILSTIFRNARSFNGRGVFLSRSSSLGIYYNAKGNSVLYLHKVEG